jgi:hypothetical protein
VGDGRPGGVPGNPVETVILRVHPQARLYRRGGRVFNAEREVEPEFWTLDPGRLADVLDAWNNRMDQGEGFRQRVQLRYAIQAEIYGRHFDSETDASAALSGAALRWAIREGRG